MVHPLLFGIRLAWPLVHPNYDLFIVLTENGCPIFLAKDKNPTANLR